MKKFLIIGGIVLVLVCAGVITGGVLLVRAGFGVFEQQAVDAMNRNPVVQEHLGSITSAELDLGATGEAPGAEVFVFDVVGAKGTGRITAEFITIDADSEEISWGELELPDGQVFELSDSLDEMIDEWESQAKEALDRNAVMQQHIGAIQTMTMDEVATGNEPGDDVFVFDVVGPNGRGSVTAEFITVDEDRERIGWGRLVLESGETVELDPESE